MNAVTLFVAEAADMVRQTNLFVIVFDKESNLFKYYFYHTEYWYDCDRTEVSYVLEKECVSKSYSPVKRYQDFCKI